MTVDSLNDSIIRIAVYESVHMDDAAWRFLSRYGIILSRLRAVPYTVGGNTGLDFIVDRKGCRRRLGRIYRQEPAAPEFRKPVWTADRSRSRCRLVW